MNIITPIGLWGVRITQISKGQVEAGAGARDEVQGSSRILVESVIPRRGEHEAVSSFGGVSILRGWVGACLRCRTLATHRHCKGDEGYQRIGQASHSVISERGCR